MFKNEIPKTHTTQFEKAMRYSFYSGEPLAASEAIIEFLSEARIAKSKTDQASYVQESIDKKNT